ncbi:MAG: glutamate racemase [Nitrospirae bacterium CG_4_10_14_3_um_filter_44_29]|nr:glutamate racemase [Nitrospirota bacterium]OIO28132.1 MAG: glutamate racemase [Nitrospirae bacterium CG1_02_44_142]PIP70583.1 MAG: glutamate racemase [Nitrospirae bacterium CG22_combo_CG10-13_8_21_14_all_44_11]PIV40430.1 MAG: glutamate racemase [Nitrospirae bacterium CG02_land_8_20_14_3_00_44_33]PIV66532.1 MAG: glutamate racemase [Nitrospirae bacterium CG01_land_8_20_14_3_00_44_22]PIX89057.1 MAG: glutamate racemase [Nitrospirae bacterium CG_4_10_14_3_um_filter_44_29]PJA81591.1 MAG: glutama
MNEINNNSPIGVFDSGVGGLTALKELFRLLPDENTIYLGDTARVPYGIRSPETVTRYSFENVRFLASKGIKLLVVACNTASSVSLEAIRKSVSVPVIGVIEPGASEAVKSTRNKKIGVIGTEATIRSSAYKKAIEAIDGSAQVFGFSCPLFVPLVEEGWIEGEIAMMIAEKYLRKVKEKGVDTLVLGCTHYPLLKKVIAEVMGSDIRLIDSAVEATKRTAGTLKKDGIERRVKERPSREFYVTDSPERFIMVGERFLQQKIERIEKIEL